MRESEGKEPIFAPRWSLLDIYVGAQLIFMLTIISGIGLFIFVLLKNPQNYDALMNDTSVQKTLYQIIIPSAILQNLATALVVFGYVRFRYHIKIRDFVFGNRPLRGLLIGVVVGIPVVLLVMGIEQLGWLETLNHQS
jgi:FtsH-binding integral membrane protein